MNPKKSTAEIRRKRLTRVLAIILAVMMFAGTIGSLVYSLIYSLSAAESRGGMQDDVNIRVGLMYGDGVTTGFETETLYGYTVGVQPLRDGVFDFVPFWSVTNTDVTVAIDANLTATDDGYTLAASPSSATVGGYHIEFQTDYGLSDMPSALSVLDNLNRILSAGGMYAFPAYIGGAIRLRVGSFTTRAQADASYPYVAGIMSYFHSAVVEPSETAVSLIDTASHRILFEYDCSDGTTFGLSAIDGGGESCYIKTPVGNVYDGVFSYARHKNPDKGINGVAVTNVLTLDEYVEGVLPYEISSTWPEATLQAFSIAARSYAAGTLGRHESTHSFDLCNGSHCQLYRGAGRVNDRVIAAVQSTHGLIITYQGEIASTFYSSSCGGVTVSIGDVWGGAASTYLTAHKTPWERYTEHDNGFWIVEVSPHELLTYLREQKGYTELHGSIAKIEILELAPESTYIKKLRITDTYGNSIVRTHSDYVRSALSAYVKSANFVVGRGSVSYTLETVSIVGEKTIDAAVQKHVSGPANGEVASSDINAGMPILSIAYATLTADIPGSDVTILTASGEVSATDQVLYVLDNTSDTPHRLGSTAQNESSTPAVSTMVRPRVVKEYAVTEETKIATASSPENFIFVGKGWGHGAGMSQYGSKDLADLGYDFEHIINAYFTDVEIVNYKTLGEFR